MKRTVAFLLVFLFLAIPALAATVDGKWAGMIDTPMGQLPVSFTFKADGAKVSMSSGGDTPTKSGRIRVSGA
jgi:hypothetical protein